MTARLYQNHCAEVVGNQEVRNQAMAWLRERLYHTPKEWQRALSEASVTLTSPCGCRVLKIDSCKVFTMDNKQQDGWKSVKFTCKTIEEAWNMLTQSIKAFDAVKARATLH